MHLSGFVLDYSIAHHFMWQVPAYIVCQVLGSTLASGALRLLFTGKDNHFPGTIPAVSDVQAVVIEFIITFYLMFIISGVATDNRAVFTHVLPHRKRLFGYN